MWKRSENGSSFFFFLSVFPSWSPPFFLVYFPEIMISQSHYSFQILQPLTDCLRSFGQAETSCCLFPGWSKACDQNFRCNLRKNMGPDQSNMYTHACSSAVWGLNVIKMFDSLCSKNRFFPYSRLFFLSSRQLEPFLITLEGLSYRESTVVVCHKAFKLRFKYFWWCA